MMIRDDGFVECGVMTDDDTWWWVCRVWSDDRWWYVMMGLWSVEWWQMMIRDDGFVECGVMTDDDTWWWVCRVWSDDRWWRVVCWCVRYIGWSSSMTTDVSKASCRCLTCYTLSSSSQAVSSALRTHSLFSAAVDNSDVLYICQWITWGDWQQNSALSCTWVQVLFSWW